MDRDDPAFAVTEEAQLRALFPAQTDLAVHKVQTSLDQYARAFIERSPFLVIGTQDREGRADVSPRGDPKGFVKILDEHTLAIPDRPGNNRLDSLSNMLSNPSVGLLFVIPGFDDTLRVSGTGRLVTEPALLKTMRVNDKLPRLAIVVSVREVFMHCAKAFRRSHLWDPGYHQDRREMPSLSKIIYEQTGDARRNDDMAKVDAELEDEYKATMY